MRFTGRIAAGSAADGKRVSEPPSLSAAGLEVFASAGAPPDLRNARVPDLEGGLLAVGAVSVPVRLPFGGLQDEFLAIAAAASESSATLPKKSIL